MLTDLLQITRGLTAIIGGGGKTTLMYALAKELCAYGRVVVCTTTHIYPPAQLPCLTDGREETARRLLAQEGCICVGTAAENGKLSAPALPFSALLDMADFVLAEADGSRGRPLKAHAAREPVIPPETAQTVLVLGASGFGKPIAEAAHRPELYAAKLGVGTEEPVTPMLAARLLKTEHLHDRVLVNQADTPEERALARSFAAQMDCPVCYGSLQKGELECWY